jgi:hypothetical protein
MIQDTLTRARVPPRRRRDCDSDAGSGVAAV